MNLLLLISYDSHHDLVMALGIEYAAKDAAAEAALLLLRLYLLGAVCCMVAWV